MCWRFLHGNICEFSSENTLGARGILALLVVVSHWNLKYGEGTLLYNLFPSGTIAVAVFFFMGGYGLMKSFDAKGYTYIKSFFRNGDKRQNKIGKRRRRDGSAANRSANLLF